VDAADFTPSANAVPPVPLPLRLQPTWCVNCGYSLAGLPSDSAVCPECGARIDPSLIVLYGWARGFQANAANTRGRPLVWVFLLIALQIVCYAPQFFVGGFDRVVALGVVAIWLLPALHLLSRRNRGNHPGGVQVRLSDAGCVQYNDLAGPSIVRDLLQSWAGSYLAEHLRCCWPDIASTKFPPWPFSPGDRRR
jgi:hypothetical protein